MPHHYCQFVPPGIQIGGGWGHVCSVEALYRTVTVTVNNEICIYFIRDEAQSSSTIYLHARIVAQSMLMACMFSLAGSCMGGPSIVEMQLCWWLQRVP